MSNPTVDVTVHTCCSQGRYVEATIISDVHDRISTRVHCPVEAVEETTRLVVSVVRSLYADLHVR